MKLIKNTHNNDLLPSRAHSRSVQTLSSLISSSPRAGASIALQGSAGSGKSFVIDHLKGALKQAHPDRQNFIFIYDAWINQGAHPRKLFVDHLYQTATKEGLLSNNLWDDRIAEATGRVTRTHVRRHDSGDAATIVLLFALYLLPLAYLWLSPFAFANGFALAPNLLPLAFLALVIPPVLAFSNVWSWHLARFLGRFIKWPRCVASYLRKHGDESVKPSPKLFALIGADREQIHPKTEIHEDLEGTQFTRTYADLLNSLYKQVDTCLIVVDNLDRLPPSSAREHWSVLQAVLSTTTHEGTPWIVVPLDPHKLESIFESHTGQNEQPNDSNNPESFIQKSFDTVLHIPPLLHRDWRHYMRERLRDTARDFSASEFYEIENVIDRYFLSIQKRNPSPRELNHFANVFGVLLSHNSDFNLRALAYAALEPRPLESTNDAPELVRSEVHPLFDTASTREVLAIQYGVSREDALHAALNTFIRTSIQNLDLTQLEPYVETPGVTELVAARLGDELSSVDRFHLRDRLTLLHQYAHLISAPSETLPSNWPHLFTNAGDGALDKECASLLRKAHASLPRPDSEALLDATWGYLRRCAQCETDDDSIRVQGWSALFVCLVDLADSSFDSAQPAHLDAWLAINACMLVPVSKAQSLKAMTDIQYDHVLQQLADSDPDELDLPSGNAFTILRFLCQLLESNEHDDFIEEISQFYQDPTLTDQHWLLLAVSHCLRAGSLELLDKYIERAPKGPNLPNAVTTLYKDGRNPQSTTVLLLHNYPALNAVVTNNTRQSRVTFNVPSVNTAKAPIVRDYLRLAANERGACWFRRVLDESNDAFRDVFLADLSWLQKLTAGTTNPYELAADLYRVLADAPDKWNDTQALTNIETCFEGMDWSDFEEVDIDALRWAVDWSDTVRELFITGFQKHLNGIDYNHFIELMDTHHDSFFSLVDTYKALGGAGIERTTYDMFRAAISAQKDLTAWSVQQARSIISISAEGTKDDIFAVLWERVIDLAIGPSVRHWIWDILHLDVNRLIEVSESKIDKTIDNAILPLLDDQQVGMDTFVGTERFFEHLRKGSSKPQNRALKDCLEMRASEDSTSGPEWQEFIKTVGYRVQKKDPDEYSDE